MWADVSPYLPGEGEASQERTLPLGKERGGLGFSVRVKDDSEVLPMFCCWFYRSSTVLMEWALWVKSEIAIFAKISVRLYLPRPQNTRVWLKGGRTGVCPPHQTSQVACHDPCISAFGVTRATVVELGITGLQLSVGKCRHFPAVHCKHTSK